MKKSIILVGLFLLFCMGTIAQHFGLQAGGVASNVQWRNDIFTVNTIVKPGFLAGVTLDIPLNNSMVVNTAINYKCIGAAMADTSDLAAIRLGYVNLDVTYDYLFDMKTYQLYVEGGGYLGYLVKAENIIKPENGDKTTEDLNIGTETTDDIKPLDIGLTIGAGVYLNKWKFGIGYQGGIINLSPGDEYILRNKMGYLRVAYLLNKK